MSKCVLCGKNMKRAKGCGVSDFMFKGKRYTRERVPDDVPEGKCPDCGAEAGCFHHGYCDLERCPVCGQQLLSCDCDIAFLVVKREGSGE